MELCEVKLRVTPIHKCITSQRTERTNERGGRASRADVDWLVWFVVNAHINCFDLVSHDIHGMQVATVRHHQHRATYTQAQHPKARVIVRKATSDTCEEHIAYEYY